MQQFLQDAYLNMWEVVVKTLAHLDCVVGFDVSFLCESHRLLQSHPHPVTDDE